MTEAQTPDVVRDTYAELVHPVNETDLRGVIETALADPHIDPKQMKIICGHVRKARRMLFELRKVRLILFGELFDSARQTVAEGKEDKTDE